MATLGAAAVPMQAQSVDYRWSQFEVRQDDVERFVRTCVCTRIRRRIDCRSQRISCAFVVFRLFRLCAFDKAVWPELACFLVE
jgi:hypothetical protein